MTSQPRAPRFIVQAKPAAWIVVLFPMTVKDAAVQQFAFDDN
jgi:hypothetical protein